MRYTYRPWARGEKTKKSKNENRARLCKDRMIQITAVATSIIQERSYGIAKITTEAVHITVVAMRKSS